MSTRNHRSRPSTGPHPCYRCVSSRPNAEPITRQAIRRGTFTSVPDLIGAIRAFTLAEFLEAEQVAKSTFFKWKALGLAPATYKLPNGQIRIRWAAYEAWLARLEEREAA